MSVSLVKSFSNAEKKISSEQIFVKKISSIIDGIIANPGESTRVVTRDVLGENLYADELSKRLDLSLKSYSNIDAINAINALADAGSALFKPENSNPLSPNIAKDILLGKAYMCRADNERFEEIKKGLNLFVDHAFEADIGYNQTLEENTPQKRLGSVLSKSETQNQDNDEYSLTA